MVWEMTKEGKDAIVRILPSCGGTLASMWYLAKLIKESEELNLHTILGELLDHQDSAALHELAVSCEATNGVIDLEGVIRHFASYQHLSKFDKVRTVVAAELPRRAQAVAHTLLPLTLVGGEYRYENGDASVPISGLVQIGPTKGSPYAHLASLIWIEDGGISAAILDRQAHDGVVGRAKLLEGVDYTQAPRLRDATVAAVEALGL